jgi:hypothetical protein
MRFWTTDWSYNNFFNRLEGSENIALKGFLQARLALMVIAANGSCDSPELVSTSRNGLLLVFFLYSLCPLFDSRSGNMTTGQRSLP